ncbi:DUF4349 domain-containing protein [Aquimarina litoralis]|uniref:DUF4349 domain-containing protein n=1 Tax=Aquimarina litoralis TaxID=584605 RepID=UPI001C595853|nr:DUF4349 domain-containing protein [Aquimarina litoralis]
MKKQNKKQHMCSTTSKSFVLIYLILFLVSCSQNEGYSKYLSEDISNQESVDPLIAASENNQNEDGSGKVKDVIKDHKIIKNADCRIKVDNVEKTTALMKKVITGFDAYVAKESFTNTNYNKENQVMIKVPKEHFNSLLDSLCSLGSYLDYKNISTVDVTEEYVDLTARLKTKLDVKERYEIMLSTKAKLVEDILLIEDNLRVIQEEIEVVQGRLKFLKNKVTYSTITINLYEIVIPQKESDIYEPRFVEKVGNALVYGWDLLKDLILMFFYIWPVLLIGVLIFIYLKFRKKKS